MVCYTSPGTLAILQLRNHEFCQYPSQQYVPYALVVAKCEAAMNKNFRRVNADSAQLETEVWFTVAFLGSDPGCVGVIRVSGFSAYKRKTCSRTAGTRML